MKGVIFNVLEDYVDENLGQGAFDNIIESSLPSVKDPFVGPGTYPDEYMSTIIMKVVEMKQCDQEDLLRDFGHYLFGVLANKYPVFVEGHNHPKDFIKTIHDVIHVEVKKLFPEASTPDFYYSNDVKNRLTLEYRSKRNLFSLAEGLLDGVSEYYSVPITVKRTETSVDKNYCIFDLSF